MTYIQKSKFSNAKRIYYKDSIYDSKFEASVAHDLDCRLMAGELLWIKKQVTIPLVVNKYHVADYRIDFVAKRKKDGVTEYIEAKGRPSETWKLKWKVFEAIYSSKKNVELIVIKQKSFGMRKIKKVK